MRLTTEFREEGRWGTAGALEAEFALDMVDGAAVEAIVLFVVARAACVSAFYMSTLVGQLIVPVDVDEGAAPAACARSQGFGGDTVTAAIDLRKTRSQYRQ